MGKLVMRKRPQGRSIAYTELKDAIQYLELPPGSVLSEGDLVARMGMSRTPIREAMIRLSEEFLINIYPQSGTYVAGISFELAKEVAYMRHLLDNDICLSLCRRRAKIRDRLDEHIYFMQSAVRKNAVAEYIRHDNLLHGAMFNYAGHGSIWTIISNSRAHYNRVLMLDLQRPGKLAESLAEHDTLIECIESGDESRLRNILDTHHDHQMEHAYEDEIRGLYPDYFPE